MNFINSLSIFLASFAMPAAAVVLDFDGVPIANEQRSGSFEEDGFRVALEGDHFHVYGPTCDKPGSTGPNNCIGMDDYGGFGPSRLRVTKIDGGPFDILSFNLLDAYQGYDPLADCLTGCKLASSNGGSMALLARAVITFAGDEWHNLAWVDFSVGPSPPSSQSVIRFDDIVVTASVPAPAAGWLLLTSLAGAAGWTRGRARHKITSALPAV